jgi:predicted amidohydrolase
MRETTLAVVQVQGEPGNTGSNVAQGVAGIAEAARQGARIVCLPEMFSTGWVSGRMDALAEPVPGPTTEQLADAARRHGVHVVAGLAEKDTKAGTLHNCAVVLGPDGRLQARYRKRYLYLGERDVCVPGEHACLVEMDGVRAAVLICYDYIFPDYVRALVDAGAELLIHPTAWLTTDVCEQWRYSPQAYRAQCLTRALENTVFLMSANHSGSYDPEGALRGVGQSAIIAPWGEILAEVPAGKGVAVARVELDRAQTWREAAAPYLADRRRITPPPITRD